MPRHLLDGALDAILLLLTYVVLRVTFGWGDRRRERGERAELRRAAKRADGGRE